jgi:NADH dehydrogenase FAD-containing subunit
VTTRVVVLGAGFGGLELATTVARECGTDVELTLIDKAEGFIFGFSKLDVMFGRVGPEHVLHRYADMINPRGPVRPRHDHRDRPGTPAGRHRRRAVRGGPPRGGARR